MQNKIVTLHSGRQMPQLGLGTWQSAPQETVNAVLEAIRVGYRHIDCAWIYENEESVGKAIQQAIAEGIVTREDLFITSKLWNSFHAKSDVKPGCLDSLKNLGLNYIDLYLIHWPIAFKPGTLLPETDDDYIPLAQISIEETWQGMENLVSEGLVRDIGVSNFSVKKLSELVASSNIQPAANQVEMHPLLQQNELIAFAKSQQIVITAYSPLGSSGRPETVRKDDQPILLEMPEIITVANKHQASPAQVLIAWALARGTVVIPKSTNPKRIAENFQAQFIQLDDNDLETINQLDRHYRFLHGEFFVSEPHGYTMSSLWDE